MPYLRYIPGTQNAAKFESVRYPAKGSWTREKCEQVWHEMNGYGRLEIVDEGEGQERENPLEIGENGAKAAPAAVRQHRCSEGASPMNGASTNG